MNGSNYTKWSLDTFKDRPPTSQCLHSALFSQGIPPNVQGKGFIQIEGDISIRVSSSFLLFCLTIWCVLPCI